MNLAKSDFCHATVECLGHKVGQGFVTPITAKVEAISQFPIPTNKKELMRFLGIAGFYRIGSFVQISHQLLAHLPICYKRK